ncbi:catalytic subunit of the mitochondrial inner membrane peptidase complex [Myxozyma melibiosi]|uniref:Mitochondrial inner membrane protease subunit n=1 Tax=Myxozyma melibiosi TaxID=54550 RepID=A0ABR1F600_9ASCO
MASRSSRILNNLSIGIRVVAAFHLLQTSVFETSPTSGLSMLPTLRTIGDNVFVNKLNYSRGRDIKTGDVVIAWKPTNCKSRICKRVAGMPGDIVYSNAMPKYSTIAADGIPFEAVVGPENPRTGKYIRVPEGHVWLLGDNAAASLDSRDYGPVPMALVIGKVSFASFWGPWDFFPSLPRRLRSNVTASSMTVDEYLSKDAT